MDTQDHLLYMYYFCYYNVCACVYIYTHVLTKEEAVVSILREVDNTTTFSISLQNIFHAYKPLACTNSQGLEYQYYYLHEKIGLT